jgi:hypothetical protein
MKIMHHPQWKDKGTYKEPIPSTDNVRAPRFEVDGSTTYIDKDASNNMTFTDSQTGTKTLGELVSVGSSGELTLTPKESAVNTTEGTVFYNSSDDHLYVLTM